MWITNHFLKKTEKFRTIRDFFGKILVWRP
nr:MAG TPA: hypothetical protein [Caudoviricetes sp.]